MPPMPTDELLARLQGAGLDAGAWSNGPGAAYAVHAHPYDKVLVATRGSIRFGLPDAGAGGAAVELAAGDRLELPAGIRHDALVGPAGVECLEAHLPAGTLGPVAARRAAGEW